MDVLDRADLPFPHSYPSSSFSPGMRPAPPTEQARWGDGFGPPAARRGEPFHFENRPGVAHAAKNTGLTVGTVMERSHTPAERPRQSDARHVRRAVSAATWSFRYETAFQILHKLRMVRPNQDRIGGQPKNHVEVDETWVGGRTRGEGRPQGSRLLCHRGASSKAGHQVRQPERRTLCRTRSARRRARP